MPDYKEHCGECGAYLATATDQDTHQVWHANLVADRTELEDSIRALGRRLLTLEAFNRPIGGNQ